jgi:hypothetical protein
VSAALEPTDGARAQIQELQALAQKAEKSGDKQARQELRQALRTSAPEVIARCSNISKVYRWMLADRIASGDLLEREAIVERARRLASEIAGENPTPLEVLLAERIASLWLLVELMEALTSAYFSSSSDYKRPATAYYLQMIKVQESASRRYLAAIKTLAQVRKLQANTPAVQYNTQINMGPPPT